MLDLEVSIKLFLVSSGLKDGEPPKILGSTINSYMYLNSIDCRIKAKKKNKEEQQDKQLMGKKQ